MGTITQLSFDQPQQDLKAFEEWRDIPGHANYQASNRSRVRRKVGGRGARAGKVLSACIDGRGYQYVVLSEDGVRFGTGVHRLVCMAFHGPPPNQEAHAAHYDGDRLNNTPANLRWASPSENGADKIRHGRSTRGSRSPKSKLTEPQVIALRQELREVPKRRRGPVYDLLSQKYGVSKWTIKDAFYGRRSWSWLSEGV